MNQQAGYSALSRLADWYSNFETLENFGRTNALLISAFRNMASHIVWRWPDMRPLPFLGIALAGTALILASPDIYIALVSAATGLAAILTMAVILIYAATTR